MRIKYITLFFLLILIILIAVFLGIYVNRNEQYNICMEPVCVGLSANIINKIDNNISPCDNFYKYACNKWLQNNYIKTGDSVNSIFHVTSKKILYYFKNIYENSGKYAINKNNYKKLPLLRTFYNSCMNVTNIEHFGFEPLAKYLNKLFGYGLNISENLFTTYNLTTVTELYTPLVQRFGSSPLFQITTELDLKNTSRFIIYIDIGSLSLNEDAYNNKHKFYLLEFMHTYTSILGLNETKQHYLEELYYFEKKLADIYNETEKSSWKNPTYTTLKNLSLICPIINWTKLINELYKPFNYTVASDQTIAIAEYNIFQQQCQLHLNYSQTEHGFRVMHDTAVWYFLYRTSQLLPNNIAHAYLKFKTALNKYVHEIPLWMWCYFQTNKFYGIVTEKIYINNKITQKDKIYVQHMAKEIKFAMKEIIENSNWMDNKDKVLAILKIDKMDSYIGFPSIEELNQKENESFIYKVDVKNNRLYENVMDLLLAKELDSLKLLITQDKSGWVQKSYIVNAFYNDLYNRFYINAAIIQLPFFHVQSLIPINYGSLGSIIGHEIVHGFDNNGVEFDENGNYRNQWTNQTIINFQKRVNCMKNQYSNYSINGKYLKGNNTISEDIADNGGLKAAYMAYKNVYAKRSLGYLLPGLNYTSDQLFFLGFAQVECALQTHTSIIETINNDPHTIPKYRIIGSISNSEEFAKTFNCPLGSPMNPYNKCPVW